MATVAVTFAFLSDAQSFTSNPGTSCTLAWTGSDGNPVGSLSSSRAVKGNSGADSSWTRSLTWETLGVPVGSTVTGVTSAADDTLMISNALRYIVGGGGGGGGNTLGYTQKLMTARPFDLPDPASHHQPTIPLPQPPERRLQAQPLRRPATGHSLTQPQPMWPQQPSPATPEPATAHSLAWPATAQQPRSHGPPSLAGD